MSTVSPQAAATGADPAQEAAELTLPQRLRRALSSPNLKTLKELSAELQVSEKELPLALEKLQRSLKREKRRLVIECAACLGCGFEFAERTRFAKPGRCPECRSGRISPPRFLCTELK